MESYLKKSIKDEKYYNSIEEWEKVYRPFLMQLYKIDKIADQYKDPYRDPDSYYTNAKKFYRDMATFLNKREEEFHNHNRLNGKFKYSYDKDEKFIKVVEDEVTLFYLKTDQFGFSAPSEEQSHPYDTYITKIIEQSNDQNKEKEIEDAIKDVAKWVYESRTIGGAFLWALEDNYSGSSDKPKPQHDFQYNRIRGGSEKGGSYIEDRVDLTLLEIKAVLETEKNNCLLANQYKNKKNMQRWLNHFKKEGYSAFETYVEFFCFNDFVDKEYNIINIISSNLNVKRNDESNVIYKSIDEKVYGKKEIYAGGKVLLEIDVMKKMLNNVNWLINMRTMNMKEIIKKCPN